MAIFNTLNIVCQYVIIFSPNFKVRIAAFAVLGISELKNSQSYALMMGLMASDRRNLAIQIVSTFDNMTLIVICAYFLWFSINWFGLFFWMANISAFCHLLVMVFVPESPLWLILTKKNDMQAIASFNRLAQLDFSHNRVEETI